jgi:hypothetical protein
MTKIMDEMRARYGGPRKPKLSGKPGAPREKQDAPTVSRRKGTPDVPARGDRHHTGKSSHAPTRRSVEGLEWTSFAGVDVLRLPGQSGNYVACPVDRPLGTFDIYRLTPRSIVVRRIRTKDVLRQIESLIHQDEETVEGERRRRQEAEEAEKAEAWRLEHQPGFYIIPGEMIEGDKPVPIGPFWKFDAAHSRYDEEDFVRDEDSWGATSSLDSDVEEYAFDLMQALREEERKGLIREQKLSPVRIIESLSRAAAAREEGHVWWEDGVFRGPPIDPRQGGWGW